MDDVLIRSNGRTSNNLQVLVRLGPSTRASDLLVFVTQWILLCLEDARFDYTRVMDQYNWHVVANVVTETVNVGAAGDLKDVNDFFPTLVFAIRVGGGRESPFFRHARDTENLVVTKEHPVMQHEQVSGDVLATVLRDVPSPPCVQAVGVSGVSDEFMEDLWAEIISEEPQTFEGAGKGFMKHPMWIRLPCKSWVAVRESSHNFGWKGYSSRFE